MQPCNVSFRENGFIKFLLMMVLVTLSILGLLSTSYQKREIQIGAENKFIMDILQQNYGLHINDATAWGYTINDSQNSSLACLFNGNPCARNYSPIVLLHNSNNEVVINTSNNMGVLGDGTVCSGYSSSQSNCNLHVDLTWRPVCPGIGNCTSPPNVIEVVIAISNSPATVNASHLISSNVRSVVRKVTP